MYFTVMDSNYFFCSILVFFNSAFHCCESFLQHQDKELYFLLTSMGFGSFSLFETENECTY